MDEHQLAAAAAIDAQAEFTTGRNQIRTKKFFLCQQVDGESNCFDDDDDDGGDRYQLNFDRNNPIRGIISRCCCRGMIKNYPILGLIIFLSKIEFIPEMKKTNE